MITADQLVAHAIGDYILQSHWMATEKTKQSFVAAIHAIVYSLPFLLLFPTPSALIVIVLTHFVIDRWRLARLVVRVKNTIGDFDETPANYNTLTGYSISTPNWLATWLLIIADNIMHVVINGLAIRYL